MTEEWADRMEATLHDHWLAQMVCDHETKMDQAVCACSMVDLGMYSSVGGAVASWIKHVMAVFTAAGPPGTDGGRG